MTATTDRLEQAIAGLKERFLRSLPTRLDIIHNALQASAARDVERGFHSLAGTASTYGLIGIATVAAEGEYLCAGDLDENAATRVAALLDRLRLISQSWQPAGAGIGNSLPKSELTI
jgi:HPt (histidine-containing phosphotransfer) domain-containing protein